MGQQRPDNPCVLVGKGHCRNVFVAYPSLRSPHELIQPVIRLDVVACMVNDRPCAVDEQGAQIRITPLTDTQQVLFAAAGFLAGHQAHPGGQLSAIFELMGFSYRRGGDRANARYVGQLAACLILPVSQVDLFLQLINLSIHFFSVACAQQLYHTGQHHESGKYSLPSRCPVS